MISSFVFILVFKNKYFKNERVMKKKKKGKRNEKLNFS